MRLTRILWLAGLWLGWTTAASAAKTNVFLSPLDPVPPPFAIKSWRMPDGLPSDRLRDVLHTRDGYLWAATFNGLARFDGVRFQSFRDSDTPELRNSLINALYEDSQHRLWIGNDTGEVAWHDAAGFHSAPLPAQWPDSPVDRFVESSPGTILALNRDGIICAFSNGVPAYTLGSLQDSRYFQLVVDRDHRLWAVRRGGKIVELINGNEVDAMSNLPLERGFRNIAAARHGGLWVRSGNRLARWQDGQWVEDRGVQPWKTTQSVIIYETANGDLFIGTSTEGVYVVSANGTALHLDRETGLPDNMISAVEEDGQHHLWIGTSGGLAQLCPPVLSMLNPEDHWNYRAVQTVFADRRDGLWIGTADAGLYYYRSNSFCRFGDTSLGPGQAIRSVLEDRNGVVWIGTQHGLCILSGNKIVPAPVPLNIPALVYALYEAKDGALWVGTQNGVFVRRNDTWSQLASELSHADVRCIVETAGGVIWLGMRGGGLARYADGTFTQFRRPEGLLYDYVWSLHAAADGSIWIGTAGGGLARWRDGTFFNFTTKQGLPSDFICSIQDDRHGNLWVASYGGIFRIGTQELERCAKKEISSVNPFVLGPNDGLAALEMSGGNSPSSCQTPSGRLYFTTSAGLAVVNPAEIRSSRAQPPVFIEEVLVDRQPARQENPGASIASALPQRLEVPAGKAQLEFRYTALDFSAPDQLRFKVRLVGIDRDWVEMGKRRAAYYTHVPPGDYEFQVIAGNNQGVWNDQGAAQRIAVQPFFWQTWWFAPSCWTGGAGLVGLTLVVSLRRRHHAKLEVLERARLVERERRRIAQDLHDDLGAGLTEIDSTSTLAHETAANTEEARGYLREISARSRELITSMDEIVWAVNPKNDNLPAVATYLCHYAEQFLQATPLRCRFDVPERVPGLPLNAEQRHSLFLAFKEALNNAVRHSGGSEVRTAFVIAEGRLKIQVVDNGSGALPAPGAAGADGLENMQHRMNQLGGRCEIDRLPEGGTCVSFILPLAPDQTP